MPRLLRGVPDPHPRLVVAGGGVGGVEAALALRSLCGDIPSIEIVSPEAEFTYRAMTVAEPFGCASTVAIPYERLARTYNLHHRQDSVARVDPERRVVELSGGDELAYTALVVAVGARPESWLENAVTFSGPRSVDAVRDVLNRLESGDASDIVFTAPVEAAWTLPLYELALLTSAWCGERAIPAPRLLVATPEADPLEIFGTAAVRIVRELLFDRGIHLHHGRVTSYDGRCVEFAGGMRADADAVIALPRLTGNPMPGLPPDASGFIPVDSYGRVEGLTDVYAVGDATSHPIKQGGLAAQQADVAAAAIASLLGHDVDLQPFRPVMRGMLLTGVTSAFLRSDAGDDVSAFNALWWPPTKVAGRHLAAYLADLHVVGAPPELIDRPAHDMPSALRDREEMRALALEMAEMDAGFGEYESALRWLQTVEWLDGVLPARLARIRDRWQARVHA